MKRLSRNVLAIVASDVGRRIIGFFTVAYLARRLGTSEFGVINIAFTVLSYAVMASAGGLGTYGARAVAQGSTGIVNAILSLRLVTACAAYALVAAIAVLFVSDVLIARAILIACISIFAGALTLEWYFQGREAMGMIGAGRLISALVYFALVLVLVRRPDDVLLVATAAVAGDIVAAIAVLGVFRARYGMPFRIDLKGQFSKFREAFPIGIGSTLGHISINLPAIVIAITMSASDVGIYSAAQKMVFFLLMFDRLLGTVLLPAAARMHAVSSDLLSTNLSHALRWILIVALPVTLGGTMLATPVISLVFGAQYASAGAIFRILIWYFFFTMLHTVYTSGLVAIGREDRYSRVMYVSAAVYAIAIIAGTKFAGTVGCAAGVSAAEAITLYLMRAEFKKFVRTSLRKAVVPIGIAGAIMCIALFLLPTIHVALSIAAGAVVYTASLFVLKGVTPLDLRELAGRFT